MWIDSHCHLTHERIRDFGSPDDLVRRAHEADVGGMLTISCQISGDFSDQLKVANAIDNVWCSIGTHPHDAELETEKEIAREQLVKMAQDNSKVIGIGESGLDYYYNNSSPEDQQASFRKHIQACLESGLPLIVHSRDAEEDTVRIIREESSGQKLNGVMHCFSSKAFLAEEALDFGFYISFSGIVTFKAAEELREVVKFVPLERILVETDAPFLAPVPYRGKTNQPAYVSETGTFVAGLKDTEPYEFALITTQNFFTLFSRAKETWVASE